MITQKFKGDDTELKMEAAAKPAFDSVSLGLDRFMADGYNASPFLLMLYDEGRAPFSDRVPREAFVEFIKEALTRFPFTGTFESYIFIIEAIFGAGSGVIFDVPAPGKLEMLVNASSSVEFPLLFREIVDGAEVEGNIVTSDGDIFTASGISGIDSEFELEMMLAEIIPAGIFPTVTLAFFSLYNFVDDVDDGIVDELGNQIVFIET